jgi:hypothetical protein
VRTLLRIRYASRTCAAGLLLCFGGEVMGDPPNGTGTAVSSSSGAGEAQTSAPTGSFFSSLKQALSQDLNYEVIRGHFDVGSPPDTHRFYCLVDTRTGKSEGYGVAGETFPRPDGMTGIKAGAVSPDSCAKVEEQGMLVTAGYVVKLGPKAAVNPSPPQKQAGDLGRSTVTPDKIDVAGVKLGMSPEQVRTVLKSKSLSNYYESMEALSTTHPNAGGRFVNVIAAWAPTPQDGESFEIMFTPVPGRERVMAIVHSVAYSTAVGAMAVQTGLVAKYGGFSGADEVPDSPTWRLQSDGKMLTGDPCNRRGIFGGLAKVDFSTPARQNFALKATPDEFRNQIEQCGIAIVTEDQSLPNGDASRQDRTISRFTVTAYSPAIALDGARTAVQLIQTAGSSGAKPQTPQTKDSSTPNL